LVPGAEAVLPHLDDVIPKPPAFSPAGARDLARNFKARSHTRDPSLRLKNGCAQDDASYRTESQGAGRASLDGQPRAAVPTCCRKALRAAGVYQLQRVGLEDALDLVAGVDGPGAGAVELDIGLPVLQGLAGLANFLVGES
jgi:hypothetical protein